MIVVNSSKKVVVLKWYEDDKVTKIRLEPGQSEIIEPGREDQLEVV